MFGKIIDEYGDKGEDYFLLFEGEVAGINYNRTEVGTRQANIQAVSLLSKWASIHKFAVDYLSTKVHQADVSFYLINSDTLFYLLNHYSCKPKACSTQKNFLEKFFKLMMKILHNFRKRIHKYTTKNHTNKCFKRFRNKIKIKKIN